MQIEKGSLAARSNLKVGDRLLAVNDTDFTNKSSWAVALSAIYCLKPVTLTVLRIPSSSNSAPEKVKQSQILN